MNQFEKLIFLEITNKQFGSLPNKEYYETFKSLNEEEEKKFVQLSREIHDIWNYINSPIIAGIKGKEAKSIQEYSAFFPVSPIVIQICNDFSLDLKKEKTIKFRNAVINIFGQDYFDKHFGNI